MTASTLLTDIRVDILQKFSADPALPGGGPVCSPALYAYTETMRTYTFKVVVEPDEGGYHAYCPALRRLGAVNPGRDA